MLDITLLIFFVVMAYQVVTIVFKEAAIFHEFGQSRLLGLCALLFPFGPFIWLLTPRLNLPLICGSLVASACYLPAFVVARRAASVFDRAGTDRVRKAQEATSKAQLASFIGFILITVGTVYALAIKGYAT